MSRMPKWTTDSQIDPVWISEKIPSCKGVTECTVQDISNATRKGDKIKDGATLRLNLSFEGHDNDNDNNDEKCKTKTLVMKQVPSSGLPISRRLGLAREALFLQQFASKVNNDVPIVPKCYYSVGDMDEGMKVIVMEDLSDKYIDSGILFGPGNPNNWSRDLPSKIADAYPHPHSPPTSYEVANETFLAIAKVHATFWRDEALLKEECGWLRGSSWVNGEGGGEGSWKASQGIIQQMWANVQKEGDDDESSQTIQWDPLVKEIVEKAMAGISWEAQVKRLNSTTPFCLVHGDFWPGNIMISKTDKKDLRILDWEMVGVGSGPQDLGQYILSNMDPLERKECEERLIRNYYEELVRMGVSDFTWEECWTEYTIGGVERWLWFLVYFCAQKPLLKWAQFFHDQIMAFVHDHDIQPKDITQPRP